MNVWPVLTLVSFLMLPASTRATEEPDPTQIAVRIANQWLNLLDSGKYNQSWDEAALLLKTQVQAGRWRRVIRSVRRSLGEMHKRNFERAKEKYKLPGEPAGDYIVVRFDTSFSDKPDAIETVTLAKDPDQIWKVSGYYVR
jgi:uncharacterized protein DUF4019